MRSSGFPRAVAYLALATLCAISNSPAFAQPTSAATTVVARVNGQPIYASEVQQQLKLVLRGRKPSAAALKLLQAQTIEQLIGRKLVLHFLDEKDLAANDKELDVEIGRIRKRLSATGVTLEQHLGKTQQDIDSLRRALAWQISWQRYLDQFLSEENLKKFYQRRQRQFDGSQVRVAHILWKVDDAADRQSVAQATEKAAALRKKITSGEVSFSEAAAQHSQSPSKDKGGNIGFITRHESMPEPFARAAFDLQPGEVSAPVATPFGVHLIQCVEIKPGQKAWRETRPAVEQAATQFLFDWIVGRARPDAKVEYTDALPYFKPGTRELSR